MWIQYHVCELTLSFLLAYLILLIKVSADLMCPEETFAASWWLLGLIYLWL